MTTEDLKVWQKAISLVEEVYCITKNFPDEERFGLTSQIRRSAVSIPSNIAEGNGRRTSNDFLRFLSIARGSLSELQTQCIIANKLRYLSKDEFANLSSKIEELFKMIHSFQEKITL